MTWVYAAVCVLGLALATWARVSLPAGTVDFPVRVDALKRLEDGSLLYGVPVTSGPYRWMRHPMYLGNIAIITGLGGLGGGIWNALALMTLAELVHREWAWRERPGRIWP